MKFEDLTDELKEETAKLEVELKEIENEVLELKKILDKWKKDE